MFKARFDPARSLRIKKYKDARFYTGKGIRWLIADKNGTSVYCDQCGNIANGVLLEPCERYILHVPLCTRHLTLWQESNPEYQFNAHSLTMALPETWSRLQAEADAKEKEKMECSLNS